MVDGLRELQLYLRDSGRFDGLMPLNRDPCDGIPGNATRTAVLRAFEDGPDTALTDGDYAASGRILAVPAAYIKAFATVEANGAGFFNGYPKILFEPHRFSRLTGRRFDASNPSVSYPRWGMRPYPSTQAGRYDQLLDAIALDPRAAFRACSYGKFQILGENSAACGFAGEPWLFAFAQARDEIQQLRAFENFIRSTGIVNSLRLANWADVARRYNGPAYAKNQYDVKLAQAAHRFTQEAQL
jgi:hypothetical protein